jgi:chromosomal replication initiation ATPase DnaA
MTFPLLATQLTFNWPNTASTAREDFIVTPSNEKAFRMIDSWPQWPVHGILLAGPEGSGKSHLARLWQEKSNARWLETLNDLEEAFSSKPGGCFIIEIENTEDLAETPLFHLINRAILGEMFLLLTATLNLSFDSLQLRDLRSRLRVLPEVVLGPPDDILLRALLIKHFTDRQMNVAADVVDYMLTRIERTALGVRRAVEILDRLTLSEGRCLSKAIVARYLRRDVFLTLPQDKDPTLNFNS